MASGQISVFACGLILVGLALENVLAHRWARAEGPVRFGLLAALALALPALGLTVLAFLDA